MSTLKRSILSVFVAAASGGAFAADCVQVGKRVTYRQAVPVPFCKGGGLPDGHLSRPDSAGFFAEQEAAEAARGLTDKSYSQKERK